MLNTWELLFYVLCVLDLVVLARAQRNSNNNNTPGTAAEQQQQQQQEANNSSLLIDFFLLIYFPCIVHQDHYTLTKDGYKNMIDLVVRYCIIANRRCELNSEVLLLQLLTCSNNIRYFFAYTRIK